MMTFNSIHEFNKILRDHKLAAACENEMLMFTIIIFIPIAIKFLKILGSFLRQYMYDLCVLEQINSFEVRGQKNHQ